jgi:hypothetical protein
MDMERLTTAGIVVVIIGVILLLVSVVGAWWVSEEYSQSRPSDLDGPCEGDVQDEDSCNRLNLMELPWIPGWVILILGIIIAIIGFVRGPRL